MTPVDRRALGAAALVAALVVMPGAASQDLVGRSRAAYASLRSYADTGTIVVESGVPGAPAVIETHSFVTRYRAPRHFYFEFRKDPAANAERLAIWCDGGDFQSWWSSTGVHEIYSGGRGVSAFTSAVFPTQGAASQIPPLLFPKAEMHGPLTDIRNARAAGAEPVNGRPSQKIAGMAQAHFGAARPVTVWIDSETFLVRRIVEDTPVGAAAGHIDRVTTTFEPRLNPDLADAVFRFVVPSAR